MINAARIYGCDVFFMGNPDFGENHAPQEIYDDYWGWEDSLALMVNTIRSLKPVFVITLNPENQPGSPAHRAVGRIVVEAVKKAADASFRPELGKPWKVSWLYVPDEKGEHVVDVSKENEIMNRAIAQHASQAFEPNTKPVKTENYSLLSGNPSPSLSSLIIEMDKLPKRPYRDGFMPNITRVYQSAFAKEMKLRQEKRHDAFLKSQGPYRFKFKTIPEMMQVSKPIVVDGKLGEFKKATPLILKDANGKEVADLRLVWTKEGLGVGVRVKKTGPAKNDSDRANLWLGDAIELFLNPNPSMALERRDWRNTWDRQYLLSPYSKDKRPLVCGVGVGGFVLSDALIASHNLSDGGYELEAWIPKSQFKGWNFKRGDTLRFDLAVDVLDKTGRKQYHWHDDKNEAWMKPDSWGLIKVQ
jgi:hypothetical protein